MGGPREQRGGPPQQQRGGQPPFSSAPPWHGPQRRHHACSKEAASLLGYPGVPALAPLRTSRLPCTLRALRLENFEVRGGRRAKADPPRLPHLKLLRLDGCRVPGGGVAGAFGSARWLRALSLSSCELPDGASQLAAAFPLLAELALLQGRAAGSPAGLGGCPRLDLPNAARPASPTALTPHPPGSPPDAAGAQGGATGAGPRLAALREGLASMRWLRSLALGAAHSSAECRPGGLQVPHGALAELLAGLGAGVPPHGRPHAQQQVLSQARAAPGRQGAAPAVPAAAGAGLHHLALKGVTVLPPPKGGAVQVGLAKLTTLQHHPQCSFCKEGLGPGPAQPQSLKRAPRQGLALGPLAPYLCVAQCNGPVLQGAPPVRMACLVVVEGVGVPWW
jgi:hypothetical protein